MKLGLRIVAILSAALLQAPNVSSHETLRGPTIQDEESAFWSRVLQNGFSMVITGSCDDTIRSGGQGTTTVQIDLGTNEGTFPVSYEMFTIPDQMEIFYEGNVIFTTGGLVKEGRSFNVDYSGTSTFIQVVLSAPRSGTEWNFRVGCPLLQAAGTAAGNAVFEAAGEKQTYSFPSSTEVAARSECDIGTERAAAAGTVTNDGLNSLVVEMGQMDGKFLVSYNMKSDEDEIYILYNGEVVFEGIGLAGKEGLQPVSFSGSSTEIIVTTKSGREDWSFKIGCPFNNWW